MAKKKKKKSKHAVRWQGSFSIFKGGINLGKAFQVFFTFISVVLSMTESYSFRTKKRVQRFCVFSFFFFF